MAVLLVTVSHLKFTPAAEEQIQALATQHEVVFAHGRQDVAAIAAQVEIVVGSAELDLVAESPGLRWIQLWSTGADAVWECPGLPEREIQVTNLRGVHAVPISEHVFALLLARIRNIPHLALNQSERKWQNPKELTFQELKGSTMVVLGTGTVGQAVARIAQGFGMYTVGIRRQGQGPLRSFDEVYSGSHLRQALKRADFVVVTLPLTTATKGLIGLFEIRAMPAHAFLISVGRGAVIDEGALVTALRSQWIAGAALDVFIDEPLPETSQLWDLPNVIITPHSAGDGVGNAERSMEVLARNYKLYCTGQKLQNLVDLKAGY